MQKGPSFDPPPRLCVLATTWPLRQGCPRVSGSRRMDNMRGRSEPGYVSFGAAGHVLAFHAPRRDVSRVARGQAAPFPRSPRSAMSHLMALQVDPTALDSGAARRRCMLMQTYSRVGPTLPSLPRLLNGLREAHRSRWEATKNQTDQKLDVVRHRPGSDPHPSSFRLRKSC